MKKTDVFITLLILWISAFVGWTSLILVVGYIFVRKGISEKIKMWAIIATLVYSAFYAITGILGGSFISPIVGLFASSDTYYGSFSPKYNDTMTVINILRCCTFVALAVLSIITCVVKDGTQNVSESKEDAKPEAKEEVKQVKKEAKPATKKESNTENKE